ncbi:MAG: hypothetical protein MI748_09985 [Opitutales bacterium]|nr:hypothetical protein [Opitutales bacterium]
MATPQTIKLSPKAYHPFSQSLLDDYTERFPEAFANQTKEIQKLKGYVARANLLGVQGPLGSGKTTLLTHFSYEYLATLGPVIYLQLASESFARPFSQIALAVLKNCAKGNIKLASGHGIKVDDEIKRLEGELQKQVGLKFEFKPEVDVANVVKASIGGISTEDIKSHAVQQYDDDAALDFLSELIQHVDTLFYVILDDFHYFRRNFEDKDYYADFVRFSEKIQRVLRRRKVKFIITLDDLVLKKRKEAEANGGGRAFRYTDRDLYIKGFTADGVAEIIHRRLKLFDYSNDPKPEFTDECVILTSQASSGNPRLILDILATAMEYADEEGSVRVGLDHTLDAILEETGTMFLDEVEIRILEVIAELGGKALAKQFDKSVGSQTTIYERLRNLVKRGILVEKKTGTESRAPKNYEFTAVQWPDS